jgi:hypothetical protein
VSATPIGIIRLLQDHAVTGLAAQRSGWASIGRERERFITTIRRHDINSGPGPRRIEALRETPVFSRVKRVRPLIDRIAAWVGRGYGVGVVDWSPGPVAGLAEAVSVCR